MISNLNDGILHICEQKRKKNKIGQLTEDNLAVLYSRFFQKKRISNNDKEIARQESYSVDMAVRIPIDYIEVKATHLVLIKDILYEIRNIYMNYEKRHIDLVLGRKEL